MGFQQGIQKWLIGRKHSCIQFTLFVLTFEGHQGLSRQAKGSQIGYLRSLGVKSAFAVVPILVDADVDVGMIAVSVMIVGGRQPLVIEWRYLYVIFEDHCPFSWTSILKKEPSVAIVSSSWAQEGES